MPLTDPSALEALYLTHSEEAAAEAIIADGVDVHPREEAPFPMHEVANDEPIPAVPLAVFPADVHAAWEAEEEEPMEEEEDPIEWPEEEEEEEDPMEWPDEDEDEGYVSAEDPMEEMDLDDDYPPPSDDSSSEEEDMMDPSPRKRRY